MPLTDKSKINKLFYLFTLILFFALSWGLYQDAFNGPYALDDSHTIKENPYIRMDNISFSSLYRAGTSGPSKSRILPKLTFALNYWAGGYKTRGYRIVNVVIHSLTAFFLYYFIILVFRSPWAVQKKQGSNAIAFFTALLWLVHPIQVNSITYIVQRMNSMAALFYILSMAFYAKARLTKGKSALLLFTGCCLSAICALFSKEIAATLFFYIFLYEWFFIKNLNKIWIKKQIFWIMGAILVFILAGLYYTDFNPLFIIMGPYEVRNFTLYQRLLTEFRVVIFYISLLLWPLPGRMTLTHSFPLSHSFIDPITTLASFAIIAGLIIWSLVSAKKHRLASFCILWFFGNLVMESSIIGLEIIFEHRLYLPSMAFFLLFTASLYGCFYNTLLYKWIPDKKAITVILCALTIFLSWGTIQRNLVWKTPLALWKDAAEKAPDNPRPHNNLSHIYYNQGNAEKALYHAKKAIALGSDNSFSYFNLARAFEMPGINKPTLAIKNYKISLEKGAVNTKPLYHLGFLLAKQGNLNEGIAYINEAIKIEPDNAEAWLNMGRAFMLYAKNQEALGCIKKALEIYPDYGPAHIYYGSILAGAGKYKEAALQLKKGLAPDTNNAEALFNLGFCYENTGRFNEAEAAYKDALNLSPNLVPAFIALAQLCMRQGKYEEGAQYYEKAVSLSPEKAELLKSRAALLRKKARKLEELKNRAVKALNKKPESAALMLRLATIFMELGKPDKAVTILEKAVVAAPEASEIYNSLGLADMAQEKYDNALLMFDKALGLAPKSQAPLYNKVCLFSRLNNMEKAKQAFNRLLDTGFTDMALAAKDQDMKNLVKTSFFQNLMNK